MQAGKFPALANSACRLREHMALPASEARIDAHSGDAR